MEQICDKSVSTFVEMLEMNRYFSGREGNLQLTAMLYPHFICYNYQGELVQRLILMYLCVICYY